MYNFMIYVILWKKLAFQNRNSRDRHFGMGRNNLPKLSVNVLYTFRKLFDFNRIFYSHDSFPREFLFKIVIKKTLIT